MPRPPTGAAAAAGEADRVIQAGRRLEGRDRHARYYAMNDHPNSSEFGEPDYVDDAGRQYRVAYLSRLDAAWTPGRPLPPRRATTQPPVTKPGGRVKLWLKLPRRRSRAVPALTWPAGTQRLTPVAPGLGETTVRVVELYRGGSASSVHRTGHAYVTGLDA